MNARADHLNQPVATPSPANAPLSAEQKKQQLAALDAVLPEQLRKEREATRVAGTSQKPRYGASQVAETAIDWATVRADARDADDRQARRAAQAIRERDGVDPKAMAGAVAASLERFRPRPS